jgi:hypothetical protein
MARCPEEEMWTWRPNGATCCAPMPPVTPGWRWPTSNASSRPTCITRCPARATSRSGPGPGRRCSTAASTGIRAWRCTGCWCGCCAPRPTRCPRPRSGTRCGASSARSRWPWRRSTSPDRAGGASAPTAGAGPSRSSARPGSGTTRRARNGRPPWRRWPTRSPAASSTGCPKPPIRSVTASTPTARSASHALSATRSCGRRRETRRCWRRSRRNRSTGSGATCSTPAGGSRPATTSCRPR